MKPQIKFDAALLEGATLDKLADGRWLINEKTGKPQAKSKGGKKIAGFSAIDVPGLYIRFNTKSYDHALVCVRPKKKDGSANGEKYTLGKLSDFLIGKTDGKRKFDLAAIKSKCADLYENGKPEDRKSNKYTLDACFGEWLGDKGVKMDGDEIIDNGSVSVRTIAGIKRDLETFSADWRDVSVIDIDSDDILDRAATIRDGNFFSPNSERNIGTRNTARRWLLSMSAIHNAAKLRHKSFNGFEAVLAKYPKSDGLQRALTLDEIKTVLTFTESQCPRDRSTGEPCPQKWLRMLALKFQILSGLRIGDVVALRSDEIKTDGDMRYIEHHASKGKRPHFLPVPTKLGEIIDQAIAARDSHPSMAGSEFLFPHREGGRFSNPRDSFDVARDILVDLELIKPEPVPGNGKRLMQSHDCRRTFRTTARDDLGIAASTVNSLLDHGESAMDKVYRLPTHEQRMNAVARLLPDHEMIVDHLFKTAGGNIENAS